MSKAYHIGSRHRTPERERLYFLAFAVIVLPTISAVGAALSEGTWIVFWLAAFGAVPWTVGMALSVWYCTRAADIAHFGRQAVGIAWVMFVLLAMVCARRVDMSVAAALRGIAPWL